jgi:uncharacterized repeat protein (TIGR03803 family)
VFVEGLEGRRLLSATVTVLQQLNYGVTYATVFLEIDGAGNLYSTMPSDGVWSDGAVVEVTPKTDQVNTLATFDGADGTNPNELTVDAEGNVYGTTNAGGDMAVGGGRGDGVIFGIPATTHALTALAVFDGTQGGIPTGGITEDAAGNLYGTTVGGDTGSVFELPAGTHTIRTLASFTMNSGGTVAGSMVIDEAGNLYGTLSGVPSTVFELAAGADTVTTLATFPTQDQNLSGLTLDADGNLYCTDGSDVFELSKGTHVLTKLAEVDGLGAYPSGLLVDAAGNLFGVALGNTSNYGSVFEVDAATHAVTTVAAFDGTNGSYPITRPVADAAGNLYGESLNALPGDSLGPNSSLGLPTVYGITDSGFVVASAPVISSQPTNQTAVHNDATFTAVVGSSPAPAAQWQVSTDGGKRFKDITGNPSATTQTLTLTGLVPGQNGTEYRAVFTNSLGTTTTDAVKLSVEPLLLVSAAHASPSLVTSTTLSALGDATDGEAGVSYKWSVVREPAGAKRPTFSTNDSNAARHVVARFYEQGQYVFRCMLSDGKGDSIKTDVEVEVNGFATSLKIWPEN